MPINNDDIDTLRDAVRLLEHPSLAARLTNMLGKPVELMSRALPAGASQAIAAATTKSLEAALNPRRMNEGRCVRATSTLGLNVQSTSSQSSA
jgi:hypothetical protein